MSYYKKDCIFCRIANHEAKSKIVFEDDLVVAFDSIDPVAGVHILITPRNHISTFMDIGGPSEISAMVQAAQLLIKRNKIERGYKLVFNGGKYQEIMHLHWHLLGGKFKKSISET